MKLKPINKTRIIENTKTGFIIKTSSFVIVSASVAYGFYFYFYQSDKYLKPIIDYTSKITDRIEKREAEKRNKPLEQNSYQNYLKEKKLYSQQLEEETQKRLEKLRSLNENKPKEIIEPIIPVQASPSQQQIQETKKTITQISKFLSPKPPDLDDKPTCSFSSSDSAKLSFHKLNESIEVKFEKKNKLNKANSDISKYFEFKQKEEEFKCPICSNDLSKLKDSERERHVNECLDRGFSRSSKFCKQDSANKLDSDKCEEEKEEEIVAKIEKKPVVQLTFKDVIPNCPICGKVLHNLNIRQNHLKKCSQVFHIKTESLVELVKKQQEKIERDLAKGLIPDDVYIVKQKQNEPKSKKAKISSRVIKLEQPNSKQDEQMQIAIALSNSINPAEDCPKQAEIRLFKSKNNAIKPSTESVLLLTDQETRDSIISKRFSSLLGNHIFYEQIDLKQNNFVKTKFKSEFNYLWNKCKYFQETEDSFYVKLFLDSGKFKIGHHLFIEKTDQDKFSDVQIINTQTAFLLADLNDQTQENLSIYCTQYQNQSQFCNTNQSGYISLDSIREDSNQQEEEEEKNKKTQDYFDKSSSETQEKNIEQPSYLVQQEAEKESASIDCTEIKDIELPDDNMSQSNKEAKKISTQNLFIDDTLELNKTNKDDSILDENESDTESNNDNNKAVFIDETKLSSSENSVLDEQPIDKEEEELPSNQSNILDKNIIDDESLESVNKKDEVLEIIETSPKITNKKRKSINIIEIDDDEDSLLLDTSAKKEDNKKFKTDLEIILDDDENISETQALHLINDSSSSLPSLSDNRMDYDQENLNKLNEEYENNQVLSMLEKSQRYEIQTNENFDPLDEVWKNFGEDHFNDYNDFNYQHNELENESVTIDPKPIKSNLNKDHEDEDEDEDIDEFIRNYRSDQKNESKSQNSTLDEESLDQLPVENKPIEKLQKKILTKTKSTIETIKSDSNLNMPNFNSLDTPNLKIELKKFGLKQLPKKQAIKKLVEIYEYTNRRNKSMPRSQSCTNFKISNDMTSLKYSNSNIAISKSNKFNELSEEEENSDINSLAKIMNLETSGPKTKKLKKAVSDLNIVSNKEKSSTSTGLIKIGLKTTKLKKNIQECTLDERLNELIELEDDDDVSESSESCLTLTQKQKSGKSLNKVNKYLDESETKKYVYQILKSDENLYLNVLNYEPLDYEKFFNDLQTNLAPRKANNKILMKVLDEFCVTFTLKNLNTRGAGSTKLKSRKKH